MKKAVIILGAGAAIPWGAPLTNELTREILEDNSFLTKSKIPLAKFIHEKLVECYDGRDSGINFETIINALEYIYSYYRNKTAIGGGPTFVGTLHKWFDSNSLVDEIMNLDFIPEMFVDGRGIVVNLANKQQYINYPPERKEVAYIGEAIKHYISIIQKRIAKYCYSTIDQDQLNSSLSDFLIFLIDSGYQPRIYLTNYDRLFPTIFKKSTKLNFFDGFDLPSGKDTLGDFYEANIPRILKDENCLNYYCMHGCINWDYSYNPNGIDRRYVCYPDSPNIYSISSIGEYTNPGDNTSIYNIVTGYNKLQRISIEPLNSFHSIYTKDCINADLIITVGYSFSDFHINRPLSNAFKFNNPNFLHITFDDKSFYNGTEFQSLENKILISKSDFLRNDLQNSNYWIKSRTGKQMIFYNGFQDFLEKKEWINSNIMPLTFA